MQPFRHLYLPSRLETLLCDLLLSRFVKTDVNAGIILIIISTVVVNIADIE